MGSCLAGVWPGVPRRRPEDAPEPGLLSGASRGVLTVGAVLKWSNVRGKSLGNTARSQDGVQVIAYRHA